jgi:sortase A
VTPLGSRRTGVADLQREVERLTEALQLAEERRRTAERTLADVARMAAADAADLRARLTAVEAELAGTPAPPAAAEPPAAPAASPTHPRRRRVKRLLLVAGLIAGAALITDGLLTIFWQEPLTAVKQSRSQSALRDDLRGLQRTLAAAPRVARETGARRMRRQALTLLHAPDGAALGSLSIPKIGLKSVVVESTGHNALTKGPGHYRGTALPGMDGTVGLAGHRTTYGAPFRHVDRLSVGSPITMTMPYGRFTYKVTGTRITTPSDASSLRSHTGVRRLVLTACHPLYSAAQRIVVTARLVSATPA